MGMIFSALGMIGIVAFVPLSTVGIVLLIMGYSADKQDLEKKTKLKKWGWRAIYIPVLVIIISLLGGVVTGIATGLV